MTIVTIATLLLSLLFAETSTLTVKELTPAELAEIKASEAERDAALAKHERRMEAIRAQYGETSKDQMRIMSSWANCGPLVAFKVQIEGKYALIRKIVSDTPCSILTWATPGTIMGAR